MSTKIHTLVDALGNPVGLFLTGGQTHDLVGADHLLPTMQAGTLIADKAFDADARVLAPLAEVGRIAVIPPKSNRRELRGYDRDIYKARHLIENFFTKIVTAQVPWVQNLIDGQRRGVSQGWDAVAAAPSVDI